MVKYIWAALISIGLTLGLLSGRADELSSAIVSSAQDAAAFALSLIGVYALWLGLLQILEDSGAIKALSSKAERLVRLLFRGLKRKSRAISLITLNLVANMLGMGNAATPFGLAAMQAMQEENTHPSLPSHDMCMFIILNTCSVQLLPLTIISVRAAAGSTSPADIVFPAFLATLITAIIGVSLASLARRFCMRRGV